MQLKEMGVGGLLRGYTNSFTEATPFNLRLEELHKLGRWRSQLYQTYYT